MRLVAGNDQLSDPDCVEKISKALRGYFAPEAVGSIYQEVARFSQMRLVAGDDQFSDPDGVGKNSKVRRGYFAHEAVGSIHQEVARFSQIIRTTQTLRAYPVRFDLLRREAESRVHMGGALPQTARIPI